MDPIAPHPPIDIALYIFSAFTRIYYTSNERIDFLQTLPNVVLQDKFKVHSLQARRTLFMLYELFRPLVVRNQTQQQMLDTSYLSAIQLIHTKFGTTQYTPPFSYPTY
jgi:hypothetical protein